MAKNKTQHTPGPWGWEKKPGALMARIVAHEHTLNDGTKFTPTVAKISDVTTDEGWANARLIAAAPELLAFAKARLAEYDRNYSRMRAPAWVAEADALIAKAEGR